MTFLERVLLEAEDLIPDPTVRAKLHERLVAAVPREILAMSIGATSSAVYRVQRLKEQIVSTADVRAMAVEHGEAVLFAVGSVLGLDLLQRSAR